MEVAYRTRNATIYVGDCTDIIPRIRRTIDTVVTSPPYNTLGSRVSPFSFHKRGHGWAGRVRKLGYADDWTESTYQAWLNFVLSSCLDVAPLVWLNHKVRFRDGAAIHPARFVRLPMHCEVIWSRTGSTQFNHKRFALSHEGLWAFGQPSYWDASLDALLTVWSIQQERNRTDHPCPFPVELASRPIRASCPPGGVVLDPFAGSCTVGVAALAHGRKFVGIEKNPAYVHAAIDRLKGWKRMLRN